MSSPDHIQTTRRQNLQPRWFVLQAVDPTTGCSVLECRFLVDDLTTLCEILPDIPDARDPKFEWSYPLDRDDLLAIENCFGASLGKGDRDVMLTPWHAIRDAPYLIHTGFELPLMLEGRKPFAMFGDIYPSEWFDEFIGKFDPFVEQGQLVRRIVARPFDEPVHHPERGILIGSRGVYFALPGEEWRIDAYLLLDRVRDKAGWNEALERFQGSLLGYEDWQNDWWIEHRRTRQRDQSV